MRITQGNYKGRQIKVPKGVIRPCMERMRISLFSTLGNIEGISFLDLFSGSGIMSLEALSRGAKSCDLVEKDYGKKSCIYENFNFVKEPYRIFIMDVFRFLKKFSNKESYEIIYLDPPFNFPDKYKLINQVYENSFLKEDGLILMHYPREEDAELDNNVTDKLRVEKIKIFGRSIVRFYKKAETEISSS